MKKIVILCDTLNDMTITTELLVNKMKKESRKQFLECEIYAYPIKDIYEKATDADIILLTPLVCFKQLMVEHLVQCPVEQIGMGAYANIDGKHVLKEAYAKIDNNKKVT